MFIPSSDNATFIRVIVDMFAATPVGKGVSFDEMQLTVGFDMRERRNLLTAAIKAFHKETGGIMQSVHGVGYMRLEAEQFSSAIAQRRNRGRRMFAKAHREFSKALASANDMAPSELIKVGRELAMVGLLSHAARDSNVSKIVVTDKPPSYTDTVKKMLEAMAN